MPQYNVHEAKSNLSKLLDKVERGEEVVLARHGRAVARLVRIGPTGLIIGSGKDDPNINPHPGDEWWHAMSDEEAEDWLEGR